MLLGRAGLGFGVIRLATAAWSMYTSVLLLHQRVRQFGMAGDLGLSPVVPACILKPLHKSEKGIPVMTPRTRTLALLVVS